MPVFHTKTIESILEPVAQQVSQLVILHEESEDGNAMPDLSAPVQAVSSAVSNLIKVGYETLDSSNDAILKHDMPPALNRVEEASMELVKAAEMLKKDPFSDPARGKLIEGARGILQGTSSLLLTFDESEVRKIVTNCKQVLEYLTVAEVVDDMQDLVTYIKNLSPGLTNMTKRVDARTKELTHASHRDSLLNSIAEVKNFVPFLVSTMKLYVTTKQLESHATRDFVVMRMTEEVNEIIRVLQLTTHDEEEWDDDDITVLRKLQNSLENKMTSALHWVTDSSAPVGGVGVSAVKNILADARRIAELCSNPADQAKILKMAGDIESLFNALCELKEKGMGNSPQAMSLQPQIQSLLKDLQNLTHAAVINTENSGIRRPAPNIGGRVDQAQRWLAYPTVTDHGLGEQATRLIVADGRNVAQSCTGPQRSDLLRLCDEIDIATNKLRELVRMGKGNSPEALALAQEISRKLPILQKKIQDALYKAVVDDFMDTGRPIKELQRAATAPIDTPNRGPNFNEKVTEFQDHANKFAETAKNVALSTAVRDKRQIEGILKAARQVKELTPQVITAARTVFNNPDNALAVENLNSIKEMWEKNVKNMTELMDDAIDTTSFLRISEEEMRKDCERTEEGIRAMDSAKIIANGGQFARRAHRVTDKVDRDVSFSEDPNFVQKVRATSQLIDSGIQPYILSVKDITMDPKNGAAVSNFQKNSQNILGNVANLRKIVGSSNPEHFPDMSDLNISGEQAPPRPPSPAAPPRPSVPDTDDEEEMVFPIPQLNQPIMMAAHDLHMEAKQWSSKDNEIIAAAKKMAILMARLSMIVRGEGGSKRELIETAKQIVAASRDVTAEASKLARECTDKRVRLALLQVCERIPTIGTQLKILSTVKATMLGAQGSDEDQEATEMLVGNAQNLMQSVKETVRAAEAASIRIRVDSGYSIRWVRHKPWYT